MRLEMQTVHQTWILHCTISLHAILLKRLTMLRLEALFEWVLFPLKSWPVETITYPLYSAATPSSLPMLLRACSIPRYLMTVCRASICWPWICRRVLVVSTGKVPETHTKKNPTLIIKAVDYEKKKMEKSQRMLYCLRDWSSASSNLSILKWGS